MTAIAAVDMALWDILGKALNVPVYQLLGGRSRDGVLVYAHANGHDARRHRRSRRPPGRARLQGDPRAVRHSRGVEHVYGVPKGEAPLRAGRDGASRRRPLEHGGVSRFVPSVFERLRREFGYDVHLLHDVHHRLTPIEAGRLGKALEPHRLFWMEDPVPAEHQASFRIIRQHTTTPIAVGEVFNSIFDCQQLIEEGLIDYIRMTVVHGGGISTCGRWRRWPSCTTCAPARTARPISARGHGRRAAFRPERPQLRHPGAHAAQRGHRPRVPHAYYFSDGYMHPGERPGLGVEIDEALAATFPYERAYLPVGRLEDGTLHSW
jgi:mannonate dehydratase